MKGESWQVMTELRQAFAPHLDAEFRAAGAAAPLLGNMAGNSALSHTLVAMVVKGRPTLFQFDQQGAPEEATDQLPFVAVGSGQTLADPFLAFIKDLFWPPASPPSLPEGVFAALWTLKQACTITPGGISEPIHIFRLSGDGQRYVARRLAESELEEHWQAIDAARTVLKNFRSLDAASPAPPPPTP